MWTWDADKMFALAGGTSGLLDLCAKGAPDAPPPAEATVAVWRSRKRISRTWLPVVVRVLGQAGHGADVLTKHVPPSAADLGL